MVTFLMGSWGMSTRSVRAKRFGLALVAQEGEAGGLKAVVEVDRERSLAWRRHQPIQDYETSRGTDLQ